MLLGSWQLNPLSSKSSTCHPRWHVLARCSANSARHTIRQSCCRDQRGYNTAKPWACSSDSLVRVVLVALDHVRHPQPCCTGHRRWQASLAGQVILLRNQASRCATKHRQHCAVFWHPWPRCCHTRHWPQHRSAWQLLGDALAQHMVSTQFTACRPCSCRAAEHRYGHV